MQVKKFEAKSMREALEMVKFHLGPEAIILSARDNSRGFGLAGEKSVEVTAAVSEDTLRRKKLAEKKMNEEVKTKFQQSSARIQKQFIEKASSLQPATKKIRPMTTTPYIDIDEDDKAENRIPSVGGRVESQVGKTESQLAQQRIREAVRSAFTAGQATMERSVPRKVIPNPGAPDRVAKQNQSAEVKVLRDEIHYLKNLLESFQKLPQSFVSRHPGADEGLPYETSATFEKLTKTGISQENTVTLLKECVQQLDPAHLKKRAFVDAWVAHSLLEQITIVPKGLSERFQVFVGPAGGGKTSTLVKIASHLVMNEKRKVAILTTDYGKVGAAEQLRIYAQILNIPFAIIRRPKDWESVQRRLAMVDSFLVDFPGLNLKSMGEVNFFRDLVPPSESGRRIHYVQSILAKDASVFEVFERFRPLGIQDVIFTCLDESVQHGLIYNFQKKFQLPLHSFGIGSKIPEDWEFATKERVVDLIFKLTKIRKT